MEDWTKKRKEGFLTDLHTAIKKDPTTSIRKHIIELKVYDKTVWTAIKQDLNPDFNPARLRFMGCFRKTKQMQLPIQIFLCLRLLLRKNGIKCLKNLCWSRHANCFEGVLIQYLKKKMAATLSKFTVLYLSFYFVYLFKLKSILFYNRVVYFYTTGSVA